MNNKLTIPDQMREYIVGTVEAEKPETTSALVKLVQEKYPLSEREIIRILLQLEAEDKISFSKRMSFDSKTLGSPYLFSFIPIWYWLSVALSIVTVVVVFAVPEGVYPWSYLRSVLGILLIFSCGFVFTKMLYPAKISTSFEEINTIKFVAFSLGLSIAILAITGLVLSYTPWGIAYVPVTLSLFMLTIVFSTVATFREYNAI